MICVTKLAQLNSVYSIYFRFANSGKQQRTQKCVAAVLRNLQAVATNASNGRTDVVFVFQSEGALSSQA
jgi:hypothetical protein